MSQPEPQSIYATTREIAPCSKTARIARRARSRQRVRALDDSAPSLRLDRLGPVRSLLRSYREKGSSYPERTLLVEYLQTLEDEVGALECWAQSRPRRERTSGASVRFALELLRGFGRMTALDFSEIPEEEREGLVRLLALEHRWCYAAAGTTRDDFKSATGRTGAR